MYKGPDYWFALASCLHWYALLLNVGKMRSARRDQEHGNTAVRRKQATV